MTTIYLKGYRLKNKEKIKEIKRKYRINNREKVNAYQREYLKKNPDKVRAARKNWHDKKREIVLNHYGNKCACCGETTKEFLEVDHINNDGGRHRRTDKEARRITHWLIKNNFPPGFQILCSNCNRAKRIYKICPHKIGD